MHIIKAGQVREGREGEGGVPITGMAKTSWLQTLATKPTHLPQGFNLWVKLCLKPLPLVPYLGDSSFSTKGQWGWLTICERKCRI